MVVVQKILKVLTIGSASLAALIFPVTLFAIQGLGRINLEAVLFVLSLYLFQPVSIVLIFLVSFNRIVTGRSTRAATGVIAFNALFLLVIAALIQAEVYRGDAIIPLIVAVPSFLFLLNRMVGALAAAKQGG